MGKLVTYVGDGVVRLPGIGLFQHGTCAMLDDAALVEVRDRSEFVIDGDRLEQATAPLAVAAASVMNAPRPVEAPKMATEKKKRPSAADAVKKLLKR